LIHPFPEADSGFSNLKFRDSLISFHKNPPYIGIGKVMGEALEKGRHIAKTLLSTRLSRDPRACPWVSTGA
jgi:hypothetical protein